MRSSRIILSIVLVALSSSFVSAATLRDVSYDSQTGDGHERRRLDIYTPEAPVPDRPLPVVVYVHGGGWYTGDKSRVGRKPDWLTARGFLFVSVNYRLLPAGRHPTNGEDLAAALVWIERNIAGYGGDPESMFLMGHSSGGHLVSLVATDERFLAGRGRTLDLVKGVVSLDTNAFDIEALVRSLPPADRGLYLAAFGSHPVGWRDASPRTHATAGKGIPPFLLLVAGPGGSTRRQAAAFAENLKQVGAAATVDVFPDQTHGSITSHLGSRGHEPTAAVERFLSALLDRSSP